MTLSPFCRLWSRTNHGGPASEPGFSMSDFDMDKLVSELRRDEGEVLHAYDDHLGYATIGVGRMIDKRKGGGISKEESAYLLKNDIQEVVAQLDVKLPWWRELNDARQRVLVNMAFNLGINGLLGFKNTLRMMREGDYEGAARGMLNSLWRRQVGDRAVRLSNMMRYGEVVA